MIKKILIPIVILSMVFFVQCTDELVNPDAENPALKAGGGGNGGGGNGGGGNGGGGGQGGQGDLYGELVICLRDVDGIPDYELIDGEHGLAYYPLPIKMEEVEGVLQPAQADGTYLTFTLNEEGEVIPEDGFFVKEVEFGRLNIVRAPQSVIDNALGEAITGLTQAGVTNITTDASGRLVAIVGAEDWLVNYDDDPGNDEDNDKTIDSPRENVAIYQELMSNGRSGQLSILNNTNSEGISYDTKDMKDITLSYGAIAAGADKTGTMTVDEFGYMNNWLLKWNGATILEVADNSPDEKGRRYYDYSTFTYDRYATYINKFVRITVLNSNNTWEETYVSLYDAIDWTDDTKLVQYGSDVNSYITGFAKAADDAVQVLEFIHESDLVQYSPYFTATGFSPPLP